MSAWDFSVALPYSTALIDGLLVTLGITIASIFLGTPLAVTFAFATHSTRRWISLPIRGVIELLRAVPLLVFMVWLYYCLPMLTPLRLSAPAVAIAALALNFAAFASEALRGAFSSIPAGQLEAAELLGLDRRFVFFQIVFPQALRSAIPALAGFAISTLKLSSIAAIISVPELLHTGELIISTTFRPLEIYSIVAGFYLTLILPLSWLLSRLENFPG